MPERHSVLPRGLLATRRSPSFEGKFGRMFRALHPAFDPDDESLQPIFEELAAKMVNEFDPPKDGKDDEESGIPALYTYLGQFIDHDITFDPASSLQKANDPDALVDFRTPAFDLDNVYGRGPDDQPYMYQQADNRLFQIGKQKLSGGKDQNAFDLNRGENGRALIGDPRNDENTIVSQFQGLLLRFHNRFVQDNPDLSFADVQREVRFHYQFVVLNDFLPRIVHSDVLTALRTNGRFDQDKLKFYRPKNAPFLPVEFSVAAYRLGHSMVRPGYRLNDNDQTLLPIFPTPAHSLPNGLTGFRPVDPTFGIDWGRFIDIDTRDYDGDATIQKNRLQFAYRIDTSLVNVLMQLPPVIAQNPSSLAARNLIRGWRMGLPSGQAVAHRMGVTPLQDSEIHLGPGLESGLPADTIANVAGGKFNGKCPLWTYILAEAMLHMQPVKIPVVQDVTIQTPRLGPVGGRIVAEVFLGLMFGDAHSMLRQEPEWQPKAGPGFALKDFVNFALGN
jgi:Animal haem peroxidase